MTMTNKNTKRSQSSNAKIPEQRAALLEKICKFRYLHTVTMVAGCM
jgi:hypothetical protein